MRLEVLLSDLRPLLERFGAGTEVAPQSFASALARHGAPPGTSNASIVVRDEPIPAIGMLGDFDPSADAWLGATRDFLRNLPSRLRWLSYADAEDYVDRLATRLREALGEQRIVDASFVGIPRGGLLVLGMLAYVLGLDADQLGPTSPRSGPVVVVDDCAYSGARLGEYLAGIEGEDVVFACLLAPRPLLDKICELEDRVTMCVSAGDMDDLTDTMSPPDDWTETWTARLQEKHRYWVGATEYVCFPWAEPDWSYWNDVTGEVEDGWSVVPPELCLEHRGDREQRALPVYVQERGRGPFRPAPDVLYGMSEGAVAAVNMRNGRSFVLEGVAAAMWRGLLSHGDIDPAAAALAGEYDADHSAIRDDLVEFVNELVNADLIQEGL